MKVNEVTHNVSRSGNFPEATFKIAANAKAFDILSSKLYTDTRLAIVRELSTNAYDAHIAAGNADVPFEVHLPSLNAPFFAIRDYGTGLSPEDVENVYTVYFASTRSDSNDFVGALGLGSKSPFSYTNQFTVTSYLEGKAYTYSAFKNESSQPSIALLNVVDTDEKNGVEIRINVGDGDHGAFLEAARKVYQFFPVPPVFMGAKPFIEKHEPLFSNEEYSFYSGSTPTSNKINVLMGNVCYAVKDHKLMHNIRNCGCLILNMPIGSCQVAASREELHLDENTVKNIEAQIGRAEADIRKNIEAAIADSKNKIALSQRAFQYFDAFDVKIHLEYISLYKKDAYTGYHASIFRNKLSLNSQHDIRPQYNTQYTFIQVTTWPLTDKEKRRLKFYFDTRGIDRSVVCVFIITDRQAFEETFGEIHMKLDEMPDRPRAPRKASAKDRCYVKQHNGGDRVSDWYDINEIDPSLCIAVKRINNRIDLNGHMIDPCEAVSIANRLGYSTICGITEKMYEKTRVKLGLEDFESKAKEYASKLVANATELDRAAYYYYTYTDFPNTLAGVSTLCDNVLDLIKRGAYNHVDRRILMHYDLMLEKVPNCFDMFNERYPLLANMYWHSVNIAHVKEYIQLKENTDVTT